MDEVETLREELESARAEVAGLAERLADREARAATLEEAGAGLRREVEAAHAARRNAVARYREVVLAHAPELPAELVTGDTLEDIDRAVQAARGIVARVRDQITAAEFARPVPAGSPIRRGPDTAAMSAGEKIRYGLASRE
jgi:uncharacterized protein involved in exopolysaccharide biosynthesis